MLSTRNISPLFLPLFFILISTSYYSSAQNNKEIINLETRADYYFKSRIYHQALPLFLKLDSIKPHYPNYIYPIGICYINTSYNEESALVYLEECNKTPNKYPSTLHYYVAKAYHLSNQFDKAIAEYEIYLSHLYKFKKKNTAIIRDIYRQLEMCEHGKLFMQEPTPFDITNMGSTINTAYPEYGPILSADETELIYTTSRPETTGHMVDPYDGAYYEDVYITTKTDSVWSAPKNMGASINTNGHDASISVTPDGQQLLIYRFSDDILFAEDAGDLLISYLNGDQWSPAEKLLGEVNSKAWEPSACLINDGNTLIFSSNREGGFGGLDLYQSKKLPNGEWAKPVNMGETVNTQYDEDSPFLHPDGQTLYFSSNGHNSMGGFDIFYSKMLQDSTKTWTKPVNLGYPINTGHDEIHFTLSADGKRIYFSTIRKEGFGDKDIYVATIDNEVKDVLVIIGIIQDSISKEPINAKIKVINANNNELIGIYNSNKLTGKYIMVLPQGGNYKIGIESEKYKICNEFISTNELTGYQEINSNINLCPEMVIKP